MWVLVSVKGKSAWHDELMRVSDGARARFYPAKNAYYQTPGVPESKDSFVITYPGLEPVAVTTDGAKTLGLPTGLLMPKDEA